MRASFIAVGLCAALLVTACGSSNSESSGNTSAGGAGGTGGSDSTGGTAAGGSGGTQPVVPSDDVIALCAALEHATGGWLDQCCSDAEATSGDVITASAQSAALFFQRDCPQWLAKSESAGRVRIDADAVAAIEGEGVPDCRAFMSPTLKVHVRGAVIGLQGEGEPCTDDHECEAGLECNVNGFRSGERDVCMKPGTERCRIVTLPLESVFADNTFGFHPRCASGYFCNGFPPFGNCDALSEECESNNACPLGEFCQPDGTCGSQASVPEGETCAFWSECEAGTFCNYDDDTCHPKGVAGSPCTDRVQCLGRCENDVCVDWCSSG